MWRLRAWALTGSSATGERSNDCSVALPLLDLIHILCLPPPLFFIHHVFTIYFQFHWSHCTQPPRRPTEISAIDARNRGERLQITVAISAAIFLCRFIKIADFFYYSLYTVEADLNNILPHVTILYFPVEVKLILICETMKKLRL